MSLLIQQYEAFLEDSTDNLEILIDSTMQYHKWFMEENPGWWASLSVEDMTWLLIEHLSDYDGEERDLIWWSWRLRLANELDQKVQRLYYIPF